MKQLKLCLVTDIKGDLTSYSEIVQRAVLGGITIVQLREKHHDINHIKEKAIMLSQQYSKPIVLDPVGCGATKIRTKIVRDIAPIVRSLETMQVKLWH